MKKILSILAVILAISVPADAKWWIFGKSGEEIGLKYLYVNNTPADETGGKITLFKETLGAGGTLKINGRASVGKGAVGSVRISLDGKASWQDIKFADNGTFEYQFKPETGRTYQVYLEVTDTAGKTNKVDDTRKEITLSEENIQPKVKETLDAMFDAYSKENLASFMAYVSDSFAGDKGILERAVKRDFDALTNITMRYTINNIAAGAQGRVLVSITYNRMVVINRTGAANTDSGSTEFVFDSDQGKLSLYSMKQPLMFGLSDAENVATGTSLGNTGAALTLTENGDASGQFTTATITDLNDGSLAEYALADGAVFHEMAEFGGWPPAHAGDLGFRYGHAFFLKTGVSWKLFTGKNVTTLTAADVTGASYATLLGTDALAAGQTYAISAGGKYYAVEIVSVTGTGPATFTFRVRKF